MNKKGKKIFIISIILSILIVAAFVFSLIFYIEGIKLIKEIDNASDGENTLGQGIGLALSLIVLIISSIIGLILSLINFLVNFIYIKKNSNEKSKYNRVFTYGSIIITFLLILIVISFLMMV